LVTSIWIGFADGSRPLVPPHTPFTITGGTWPATIWSRFAADALGGTAYGDLPEATNTRIAVEIDLDTGSLAGSLCPG
ncbi:MAG: hypothetical protein GWN79_11925, partial [Actinobacteria bacterium]|nr:hypothetical protein [Actinomycetota bacterium]NIS32121.1 hypothetical protein [Actinomycetota bacterium]NIU19751.1 hypothetical protein [Actinomycetota bacterium]NIU67190.1 hypothetical protein [Actinomycetota bacterium]NIV56231.1 hypothetical protein [Actinomycetota bacterium]